MKRIAKLGLKSIGLILVLGSIRLYLSVIYTSLHKYVIEIEPPNLDRVWFIICAGAVIFVLAELFDEI
jgi:hypothetical protein